VAKVEQTESLRRAGYTSAAEHAYSVICHKILDGELEPGARLTRRAMARLTGVSIIPVIEALHRLENEGLVESLPYYGASVIRLTREIVRDRVALRLAVEGLVARLLSRRLDAEAMRDVLAQARMLDNELAEHGNLSRVWEEHYEFHVGLARLTGCPSLVDSLHRIHLFLLLEWRQPPTLIDSTGSLHVWLIRQIMKGDPDQAEKAVHRHIAANGQLPEDLLF
jgi:DNA-binding GntR family transcriptional regulator